MHYSHDDAEKEQIETTWDVLALTLELFGTVKQSHTRSRNVGVLCPFHDDHTESLWINVDPNDGRYGLWRCYAGSCGERGHFWTLLQRMWGCHFGEAKKRIAERLGITLHSYHAEIAALPRTERDQRALRWFTRWSQAELYDCPEALAYLLERGLTFETIKQARLGYTPPQYTLPLKGDPRESLTLDDLVSAGIMGQTEDEPPRLFHRFKNRIIIPILDGKETVTLTGRTLSSEAAVPKYLNLPGAEKGLLGLNSITPESETVVLVEGQFDALLSAQVGVPALAILGSDLLATAGTLAGLLPHKCGVTLALDADAAGQKQITRMGAKLLERGIPCSVLTEFGEQRDPAEFITQSLAEGKPYAWEEQVFGAEPYAVWYLRQVPGEKLEHPMRRSRVLAPLMRLLKRTDTLYQVGMLAAMERLTQDYGITARHLERYLHEL